VLAEAVLAKMRARLPGAIQLVYDNYNALAIGFGPTERTSDAVISIAVYARGVNLYFIHDGPHRTRPHRREDGVEEQMPRRPSKR
jgi:hypothetical protein